MVVLRTDFTTDDCRWSGPEKYGIAFSHLNRFLECPERFYFYTRRCVDEDEGFKLPMYYGSVFHAGEEAARKGLKYEDGIESEGQKILARHPTATAGVADIVAWAKMQYREYQRYWKAQPQLTKRKEVFAERSFKVPYRLPSGRIVWLRGVVDGAFTEVRKLAGDCTPLFYVQENKTKGKIDEEAITKGLAQELQSLFYVIAVELFDDVPKVNGLLYNVIRRPFSERWAPRKKKSERRAAFLHRYATKFLRVRPKEYFFQWKCMLSRKAITEFRRKVFDPILERLCTWFDWILKSEQEGLDRFAEPHGLHWQAPFGTYNSLAGGWRGSYFEYITSNGKRTSTLVDKPWGSGKYAPGDGPRRADGTRAPRPRKRLWT